MAIIFDGKAYARKQEDLLYHKIGKLSKKPSMAAILVGGDPASKLYVSLKQKAAERVGIEMDVYEFPTHISKSELIRKINHLNSDQTLDGIMIQLPLPGSLKKETDHIINHISPEKDVDGLRENSKFIPATVKAVLSILDDAKKKVHISPDAYTVVVGADGQVGRGIVEELSRLDYEVGAFDVETSEKDLIRETRAARVIISATGTADLITKDHIKKGAVVIDVGSPKGDVDFPQVKEVASFITPVPGGVGPVTVVSLLVNLVEAVEK
jgi:methylenetetrahydrofolate dehydrogenase (NADP+)/methenyltetrahydrofolate cyclohydrolase